MLKVTIAPNEATEFRTVELTNHGLEAETIEVTSFLEPILSTLEQDSAHPAFNNLFLNYEYIDDLGVIIVNRRKRAKIDPEIYLGTCFYTENQTYRELEFEIDKEKFYGRNNILLPKAVLVNKWAILQIQLLVLKEQ